MNPVISLPTDTVSSRTRELFKEQEQSIVRHTDHVFVRLMIWQWVFCVALALWISPRTWIGAVSQTHLHVWAAVFLGGASAYAGSYSPDGQSFAYEPITRWEEGWKRYYGGQNFPIWIVNLKTFDLEKIPSNNTTDTRPVWVGDSIYFFSNWKNADGECYRLK